MRFAATLSFFLLVSGISAQDEPKAYTHFEGRIVDIYGQTIEFAHIINLSRRFGVVSDRAGRFVMPVNRGDSLMLTHVSHVVRFVTIDQEHFETPGPYELIMLPKVFELREVVIRPLPRTRLEFRHEFVNIDLPPPPDSFRIRMPHISTLVYTGPQSGFGIVMKGPFQTYYDLFSKEARQLRKLNKELAAMQLQEEIEKRYNHLIIFRLTGIADPAVREEFMQYCNMPVDFILEASEYDLYMAILRCFESFRVKGGRAERLRKG